MPINITMPALSPTMEEGKLAKWHVKEGDNVSAGDVIAEIETDKATMEVEAVDEGKIGRIVVSEGTDNVKVNAVIAVLLADGEDAGSATIDVSGMPSVGKPQTGAEAVKADMASAGQPEETPIREERPGAAEPPQGSTAPQAAGKPQPNGAGGGSAAQASAAPQLSPLSNGQGRVFASPLARRLASEAGIELTALQGSGPHGRVIKRDVETARTEGAPQKLAPAVAQPSAQAPALARGMTGDAVRALYEEGSYEVMPLDGMRRTVASRLTEAKQTVPHFYLTMDCRIDGLMQAREEINKAAPKDKDGKPAYKLSVNDFVMKAWGLALQQVPAANATWAGDSILLHKRSDVAVAVAVPGGLFTPVVRGIEGKTLRQISEEVRDYAQRAKTKKLAPHEYQGGSSSVSNLGMYGITNFAAVINPPHGTILAVGVGEERVYAENGQVKTGQFMTVTLSCDHRSVDGALGAELLGAFKRLIETPVMMLA